MKKQESTSGLMNNKKMLKCCKCAKCIQRNSNAQKYCPECRTVVHKEYLKKYSPIYHKNKYKTDNKFREKMRKLSKNTYERTKDKRLEKRRKIRYETLIAYGGNPPRCSCCGEQYLEFLVIDHIGGGGGAHRKRLKKKGVSFYRWLKNNNYPDGFRILCHNCNMADGFYGYCPHTKQNRRVD